MNNHVTPYIAVSVLSIGTILNTFLSHVSVSDKCYWT